MRRPDLTNRQAEVLNFMISYFQEQHQLPSSRSIADHFNFASQTASMSHIFALTKKGYIEHNDVAKYKYVLPTKMSKEPQKIF